MKMMMIMLFYYYFKIIKEKHSNVIFVYKPNVINVMVRSPTNDMAECAPVILIGSTRWQAAGHELLMGWKGRAYGQSV